ncbi:MAG TPA: hypothetical protein VF546_22905 [Pyrinomonadaceae bacterium]|jgi:hypothetical protein
MRNLNGGGASVAAALVACSLFVAALPAVRADSADKGALALPTLSGDAPLRAAQAGPRVGVPIPPIGGGGGGGAKVDAKSIAKNGPQFLVEAMRRFSVRGLFKRGWPVVFEYALEANSTAEVTIGREGEKQGRRFRLFPTDGQRREIKIPLTKELGELFDQKPQVGTLSINALKNGPEPRQPAEFVLYGLGVGDRAVGSLLIDQFQFDPSPIHPKLKEQATYRFRSLGDFDDASVEIIRPVFPKEGPSHELVAERPIKGGLRKGQAYADAWDGRDDKGKVAPGRYKFRVRVWIRLHGDEGGEWSFRYADQSVRVE